MWAFQNLNGQRQDAADDEDDQKVQRDPGIPVFTKAPELSSAWFFATPSKTANASQFRAEKKVVPVGWTGHGGGLFAGQSGAQVESLKTGEPKVNYRELGAQYGPMFRQVIFHSTAQWLQLGPSPARPPTTIPTSANLVAEGNMARWAFFGRSASRGFTPRRRKACLVYSIRIDTKECSTSREVRLLRS